MHMSFVRSVWERCWAGHECEVEVEKEYRKISRTLKIDALGFTGSLIASFINGGLTAVGAAATFAKGIIDANKYYTDVHEHNGYFLWKLNKRSQKLTP